MKRRVISSRNSAHVALHMLIMQVSASLLHFLERRNAGVAFRPLFWPVNFIKIVGRIAQMGGHSVYFLFFCRQQD